MALRRGPFAVIAAAAGFVGAIGLHASGTKSSLTSQSNAPTSPSNSQGSTTTLPNGRAQTPTTTTTVPPQSASAGSVRSATGTTYQYGYGQLAVHVTVSGATITGLDVVGLQTAESYSQQLAQQALPILRKQVLAAQSVKIYGVSGATYTAEAYAASIQSALHKLHLK